MGHVKLAITTSVSSLWMSLVNNLRTIYKQSVVSWAVANIMWLSRPFPHSTVCHNSSKKTKQKANNLCNSFVGPECHNHIPGINVTEHILVLSRLLQIILK